MKVWIAREKTNVLYIYDIKPMMVNDSFIIGMTKEGIPQHLVGSLSNDILPEVTFENSPQEVELKLV